MTTLAAPYNAAPSLFCLPYIPVAGSQQITGMTTSTALTVPATATAALIQCEGNNVRYWDDGTVPTATVGMLLAVGGNPLLYAGNLATIRFIQVATGAILNVAYYK